jgi:hypothetical protein
MRYLFVKRAIMKPVKIPLLFFLNPITEIDLAYF